jgi:PAS domain S-box-containing protein
VDHSLQGLAIIQDGRVVFANQAMARITGYSVAEMTAMAPEAVHAFVHPEDRTAVWQRHEERLSGHALSDRYEFRGRRKDGCICWLELYASRIDYQGRPAVQAAYMDITERKRYEQVLRDNQEQFRLFYESSPFGYQSLDTDGIILEVNPAWLGLLDYDRHDVIGKWFGGFLTPSSRQAFRQRFAEFKEVGRARGSQLEMVGHHGETLLVEIDGRASYDEAGQFVCSHCVVRDVTEQKAAERALKESEERYRTLVEGAPVSVLVVQDGVYTYANPTATKSLGYRDPAELVGQNPLDTIDPDYHETIRQRMCDAALGETNAPLELRIVGKDGTVSWSESVSLPIRLRGEPATLVIGQDITARRGAEERLRESETRFRQLVQNLADGVFAHALEGRFIMVNDAACRNSGYSREELLSMTVADIDPDSAVRRDWARYWHRLPPGRTAQIEAVHRRKDGSTYPVEVHLNRLDLQGRRVILAVARDITERKAAEEELRLSEEKFRLIAETGAEDIWQLDSNGRVTYASPAIGRIFGYTLDEVVHLEFTVFFPESELARAKRAFASALSGETYQLLEFTGKRKDGSLFPIEVSVTPVVRDAAVVGVQGIARDITERKRAEDALRASERKHRLLLESAGLGIGYFDLDGRVLLMNDRAAAYLGGRPEDFVDRTFSDLFPAENAADYRRRVREVAETRESQAFDDLLETPAGARWFHSTYTPTVEEDGEVIGVQIISDDITALKEAEQALRESEREKAMILNSTAEMLAYYDTDLRVIWANRALGESVGKSPEELVGMRCCEIWHQLSECYDDCPILHAREARAPRQAEQETPDGRRWFLRGYPVCDERGRVVGLVEFRQDITERKRAEEALRESEEKFRLTFDRSPVGAAIVSPDFRFQHVNAELCRITGYSEQDLLESTMTVVVHPDDVARDLTDGHRLLEGQIDQFGREERCVCKNGQVRWVRTSVGIVRDVHGRPLYFLTLFQDITERKETAEAVRLSEEKFRSLFESMAAGCCIDEVIYKDGEVVDYRILDVNPSYERIMGIDRGRAVGALGSELYGTGEPPFLSILAGVAETGEPASFEDYFAPIQRHLQFTVSRPAEGRFSTVFTDISDRQRAEEALRTSQKKLETIFDSAPVMMLVLDEDRRVCNANRAALEVTGHSAEKIEGLRGGEAMRCVHSLEDPSGCGFGPFCEECTIRRVVADTLASGRGHRRVTAAVPVTTHDGADERRFEVSTTRVDAPNQILTLVCLEDITERLRAEAMLRQSEETHRALVASLPDIVMRFDRDGRHVFVSENVADVVEIDASQFIGKTHRELGFDEAMCGLWEEAIRRVFDSGASYETTFSFEGKRGTMIFNWRLVPELGAAGRTQSVLSISRDVTAQRQAERALQETLRTSDDIVRTIPSGLFIYQFEPQDHLILISANPEAERLTGIRTETCKGREFNEIWPEARRSGITQRYLEVMRTGRTFETEDLQYTDRRLTGAFRIRAFVLPKQRLGVAFENITERRRAEEALRESEEKFRAVFEQAPDSVMLIDAETGALVEFNEKAHNTLGYTRAEFRHMTVADVEAHESKHEVAAHIARVTEIGHDTFETMHRTKDGRVLDVLVTARVISLRGRRYFASIWTDITERKRAEVELERHRAELKAVYDNAPVMMCVLDADRRVQYANRAFADLTGVSEDQLQAGRACGVFGCINARSDPGGCGYGPECQHCQLRLALEDTLATGTGHRDVEYRATLERNGLQRAVVLLGATALVAAGDRTNLLLCLQDITSRVNAETQLQRTTKLLAAIRDAQALYITDGNVEEVYRSLLKTLVSMTDSEYGFLDEVLEDERGPFKRNLAISNISWDEPSRQLYEQLRSGDLEFRDLNNLAGVPARDGKLVIANDPTGDARSGGTPDGHPSLKTFMGIPLYFGGRVVGVAGVANRQGGYDRPMAEMLEPFALTCAGIIDAVRRAKREEQHVAALRESEETARVLLNAPGLSALLIDCEGRILALNATLAAFLDEPREQLIGRSVWDLCPSPVAHARRGVLARVVRTKQPHRHEEENGGRWSDTAVFPILGRDGQVHRVAILASDITERKRAEQEASRRQEELVRVSRLSTLGEMASGLAHELNQPLSAILSYTTACMRSLEAEDAERGARLRRNMERVADQAKRAGEIIRRIRAFAQQRLPRFDRVDLNRVVDEVWALLRSDLVHREVQAQLELADDLPPVEADAIQLEQVLLNLARNGLEAMQEKPPSQRRLSIRTYAAPEGNVHVAVRDSGPGVDSQVSSKVFDAFFTTKDDGLGIGLSISRSIIEMHRGRLWVQRNEDAGCTFVFSLPPLQSGTDGPIP